MATYGNRRGAPVVPERKQRINDEITAREVRVSDPDNKTLGVMTLQEALALANEHGTDLVEIAPTAKPPVCRLIDYGKFRYAEQKRAAEAKAKQKVVDVKEVVFRPGTDEHDYQVKLRNLRRFIENGDKGKITLRFRGREIAHKDIGLNLLIRIRDDMADIATAEAMPKLEGRQMIMMLVPTKKQV